MAANEIETHQFKKMLKNVLPEIAIIQKDGINLELILDKLHEYFDKPLWDDEYRYSFEKRMFWSLRLFKYWLSYDMKFDEKQILLVCVPLYRYLQKELERKIKKKTE